MLRKIRIFAATVFFVLITLLFLDFTGTIHTWFGWMAKLQFWPAVLALNVGVVAGFSGDVRHGIPPVESMSMGIL